jgi:hypothetical protein
MRERFTANNFRKASLAIIEQANVICADYRAQGYNLTLRQVYYQFVARDLLKNTDRNYKRLGSIINDARLCGLMDWDHIQDRTREVAGSFSGWNDPGTFMDSMAERYFEALWEGQAYRPEVWVEKDALKDVIAQARAEYRVPYFSCRGYTSQTAMYDAAKRMERRRSLGQIPVVIHLGDHDPSGLDMTRDIRDRLSMMSYGPVEVRRIALNMDQIETYNPPPNPAKLTDSRGTAYVEEFGDDSWELDALEPSVLTALIREEILTMLDEEMFADRVLHETEQESLIRQVASRFTDLSDRWDEVEEVLDS